jgi:uncharacterized membrane protein YfcA
LEILIFLAAGVLAGIASGFFGIGGGIVVVPLCLAAGEGVKAAIALSTMQMTFSSIYGNFINARDRLFSPREYLPLGLGGLLGASCGAYLLHFISAHLAAILFLSVLLLTFAKSLFAKAEGESAPRRANFVVMFAIGLLTAAYAGLVGIGGGFIVVAFLNGFFGVGIKQAVSVSLFFVLFVGSSAFVTYWVLGYVDFVKGLPLAIGALLGVRFGITAARRVSAELHKRAILAVYVLMIALTIYKIASGEI